MRIHKYLHIISIMFISMLIFTNDVLAQGTVTRSPGITPESPLYFLDTWMENIDLAFTRGREAKARKQYQISQEKIAEIEVMTEKNNTKAIEAAAKRYTHLLNGATQDLLEAASNGEEIDSALSEQINTATSRSTEVLQGVLEKVPPPAQEAIQRAIDASSSGATKVIEALPAEKREEVQQRIQKSLEKAPESIKQLPEARTNQPRVLPNQGTTKPGEGKQEAGQPKQPQPPEQGGQRGR